MTASGLSLWLNLRQSFRIQSRAGLLPLQGADLICLAAENIYFLSARRVAKLLRLLQHCALNLCTSNRLKSKIVEKLSGELPW